MRRGAGPRRAPARPSTAFAPDRTPSFDFVAFARRDSDAASHCSSIPSSAGNARPAAKNLPPLADRSSQAAALRAVNEYLATFTGQSVFLKPPLPAARDISDAFRHLLSRLHLPINAANALDDDLINVLRLLHCPYKLTRSALKAPGTPHSWPPLLSVLHWLTQFARVADSILTQAPLPHSDLPAYFAQSYSSFLSGDDDAVYELDEEFKSKALKHTAAAAAATEALEKEAAELEARRAALVSGPSRLEKLEAERAVLTSDIRKFEAVIKHWSGQVATTEGILAVKEKELGAKEAEALRIVDENEGLKRAIEQQGVNLRDADRMRRELQIVEQEIEDLKNQRAAAEDEEMVLDADISRKFDELEVLAVRCNESLKKLKLGFDFQYAINPKGASLSEVLDITYKTILKPALNALAEDAKKSSVLKLEESIALQEKSRETARILEDKKDRLAALQVKLEEVDASIASVKSATENHVLNCASEAEQMKQQLQMKEHQLDELEKEAEEFLKSSEQKLQDAKNEGEEEVQLCAQELLALIDSVTEYKEFMEMTISQMKKGLNVMMK